MKLRDVSNFTDNEYKQWAQHKNFSAFANVMSGLNFSSNKVIYTLLSENITSFQKTENVANITALKTDYHGGSSNLNGVIFNNVKDYIGGNNLLLIDKKGDMGSRLNPVCAAPRYNFVRKSKLLDYLFIKEDKYILEQYEFEGSNIEYKFIPFIVPLILVNGNRGIGSGHAQKILPRSLNETIEYIFNYLDNKKVSNLIPSYNGFLGSIDCTELPNQYIIKGNIERKNKTTTIITEVPISETYISYKKKLDILEDKKIIKGYEDLCDTRNDKFLFIIKHERDLSELTDEQILDKFKLVETVTENLTVIDENNTLKIFNSVYELFNHYIKIRLDYYVKRKEYLINKMKVDINILENRIRFINDILNDIIVFKGNKKSQIEKQLKDLNYYKDESYDYLLNMNIHSLTEDKITDLENRLSKLIKELEDYLNKDVTMIWKEELNNLLVALGEKKLRVNQSKLEDILPLRNVDIEKIVEIKQEIVDSLDIPKELIEHKEDRIPALRNTDNILSIENIEIDDLF